jgi:hypothetical protein
LHQNIIKEKSGEAIWRESTMEFENWHLYGSFIAIHLKLSITEPTMTEDFAKAFPDELLAYCTNCGIKVSSNSKFCHSCGTSTTIANRPASPPRAIYWNDYSMVLQP